MAAFKASARSLDQGVGAVLNALDELGLADDTLIVCTTDHGLAFPGAKATLYRPRHRRDADRCAARAASPAARSSTRWSATSTSTRRSASSPASSSRTSCRAARCCRSSAARSTRIHDEIFAEVTFHAAYEPQRAVRTERWKYIRRFDDATHPVLANCDDSASKELLVDGGLGRSDRRRPSSSTT